jgi:hypothetical protein
VSQKGVQRVLMSYLTIWGSNHVSSRTAANSPESSQWIKKVPHALIKYHYSLETCQWVSYCFQCHLFIIFFKSVSRGRFTILNIVHCKLVWIIALRISYSRWRRIKGFQENASLTHETTIETSDTPGTLFIVKCIG